MTAGMPAITNQPPARRSAPHGKPAKEADQPDAAMVEKHEDHAGDAGGVHREDKERVRNAYLAEKGEDRVGENDDEQGDSPRQAEGDREELRHRLGDFSSPGVEIAPGGSSRLFSGRWWRRDRKWHRSTGSP